MRTPPSAPSPSPCAAAKRKTAAGEVSGDMICEWGQSFRLSFARPLSTQGRLRLRCSLGSPCLPRGAVCRCRLRGFPFGTRYGLSSHPPVGGGSFALPFLRTGMFFQNIPVFRSAYFPIPHRPTFGAPVFRSAYSASRNARASAAFAASIKPYYGLCSKTLDLQVRSAHPPMPHRNVFSKLSGVPLGLFGKSKRSSSSRFAAFGGRGELRSPLHPPLPPPWKRRKTGRRLLRSVHSDSFFGMNRRVKVCTA